MQGNHEHLFLQGEDKLYLNPEEGMPHLHKTSTLPTSLAAAAAFIGNKQWQIVPLPHAYLSHNWPIRVSYQVVSRRGNDTLGASSLRLLMTLDTASP
jgi:hypothetical protein